MIQRFSPALVIDDWVASRACVTAILDSHGIESDSVGSVELGLRTVAANPRRYQMVILDFETSEVEKSLQHVRLVRDAATVETIIVLIATATPELLRVLNELDTVALPRGLLSTYFSRSLGFDLEKQWREGLNRWMAREVLPWAKRLNLTAPDGQLDFDRISALAAGLTAERRPKLLGEGIGRIFGLKETQLWAAWLIAIMSALVSWLTGVALPGSQP